MTLEFDPVDIGLVEREVIDGIKKKFADTQNVSWTDRQVIHAGVVAFGYLIFGRPGDEAVVKGILSANCSPEEIEDALKSKGKL